MQSARTVTLDCLFLELCSFETENSRYCNLIMSALRLEKVFVKVYAKINQHQTTFRMQEQ